MTKTAKQSRTWRRARTRQKKRDKTAEFYRTLMLGRDPSQFITLQEFLSKGLLALSPKGKGDRLDRLG